MLLSSLLFSSLDRAGAEEDTTHTLYVGGTGTGNYTRIQEAVDTAETGDRVFVYNGVYHENLVIDKSLSLIGEDAQETIIDGRGLGDVVNITASHVNVSRFTLKNGRDSDINRTSAGITLMYIDNGAIAHCIISECEAGVNLHTVTNTSIQACGFSNIMGNLSSLNLYNSTYNQIDTCTVTSTLFSHGMSLTLSSRNRISNCTVSFNTGCGIAMKGSSDNTITATMFSDNTYGICMFLTENRTSQRNRLYENTFRNNSIGHALDQGIDNLWDNGLLGNYWDDYAGEDTEDDGIGDTPYLIPGGNNSDRYPLMEPLKHLSVKPTVTIITPENNAVVTNTTRIQGSASTTEDSIESVRVKIAGGNWITVKGTTSWYYDWDTTDLTNGAYTIYAQSWNGNTYSKTEKITVVIHNQIEEETTPGFTLLILMSAMLIVVLVWKKRQRN